MTGQLSCYGRYFLTIMSPFLSFRCTVFLPSHYSPMMHEFVIDGKISGKSNSEYTFDVYTYSLRTGDLIAVGMRNKNTKQQGLDSKSLSIFLAIIDGVSSALHSFRARIIHLHTGTNLICGKKECH